MTISVDFLKNIYFYDNKWQILQRKENNSYLMTCIVFFLYLYCNSASIAATRKTTKWLSLITVHCAESWEGRKGDILIQSCTLHSASSKCLMSQLALQSPIWQHPQHVPCGHVDHWPSYLIIWVSQCHSVTVSHVILASPSVPYNGQTFL